MRRITPLSFLALFSLALSPLMAQTKRIPVAFSAVSATQAVLYVAKEAGPFEKHGLSVDLVCVSSGTKVAQAVIAREFPVALPSGAIVNANLAGGTLLLWEAWSTSLPSISLFNPRSNG